jgi:Iap family predicted aminopeptidase
MRDYPADFRALVASSASDVGVEMLRGLRLRNATDGVIALRAGYPSAMLGSVDEFKMPTDYHWPTDTPDRVRYSTVAAAAKVCRRLIERLAVNPT